MSLPPENPRHGWRLLALAARVIVGGLFLVSAYGKIVALEDFVKEVREYELLPLLATNSVAYVLPWIELFAGLLLVTTIWRKEARLIIAALLVVFTIAKIYAFATGRNPSCGCGGDIAVLRYIYDLPQGIVTNLILLALLWADHHAQRLTLRRKGPLRRDGGPSGTGIPD